MRKRSKKSGLNPSNQYATIVESVEANELVADNGYHSTFNLSQFFRATTIAKNFQFYRAKKVKWEYMPLYNTFQESNSVAVVGKPQVYFMMNRDQDPYWSLLPASAQLQSLQSAGADPKAFTKNLEIVYKPNWCSPGLSAYSLNTSNATINSVVSLGMRKQFGWLPTPNKDVWNAPDKANFTQNPVGAFGYTTAPTLNGAVIYNGHNLYIQQDNDAEVPVCKLIITVEWEFKLGKQNYAVYSDPVEPLTKEAAVENPALGLPTVGLTPGA